MIGKLEVLKNCTVDNNIVKLPDVQLERKVYLEVKKALELIGGKWKGGKTFGFVFQTDPTELLKQIAGGENRNPKKEFQFFATPENLAKELAYLADLKNHDTILEPSAGQGSLIKEINKVCNVVPDCYEIMDVNNIILSNSNLSFRMLGNDFLICTDDLRYSKIIANPPFSKNRDITHVYKMFSKLERGGRLVTIMSKHWQNSVNKKETEFREFLDMINAEIVEIDAGEFKSSGTNIATVIVIINKPI